MLLFWRHASCRMILAISGIALLAAPAGAQLTGPVESLRDVREALHDSYEGLFSWRGEAEVVIDRTTSDGHPYRAVTQTTFFWSQLGNQLKYSTDVRCEIMGREYHSRVAGLRNEDGYYYGSVERLPNQARAAADLPLHIRTLMPHQVQRGYFSPHFDPFAFETVREVSPVKSIDNLLSPELHALPGSVEHSASIVTASFAPLPRMSWTYAYDLAHDGHPTSFKIEYLDANQLTEAAYTHQQVGGVWLPATCRIVQSDRNRPDHPLRAEVTFTNCEVNFPVDHVEFTTARFDRFPDPLGAGAK